MTRLSDMYGLQVTADEAAFKHWLLGFEMSLTFDHSGIQTLGEAVRIDPNFALARATLGHQQIIHGFGALGRENILSAVALVSTVSEREASQIGVLSAMAEFDGDALTRALEHIERWPTDICVFSKVVGAFGLLAFSGDKNWQQANVDLFLKYAKFWPEDDWWYLTTLGFMQSDAGDLVPARSNTERAWHLQPNGNCAHSLSHVQIEEGALVEGRDFISQWLDGPGQDSDFRHHLVWHGFVIDSLMGNSNAGQMQSLYAEELDANVSDPMPLSTFADNASFLWRGKISGFEAPANAIEDTLGYMDKRFSFSGFGFADIHRIMIVALCDSGERKKTLKNELLELKNAETDTESVAHGLVDMMNGFEAYAQQDYLGCARSLGGVVASAVKLGGSNPQRSVVKETFMQACRQADIDPLGFV